MNRGYIGLDREGRLWTFKYLVKWLRHYLADSGVSSWLPTYFCAIIWEPCVLSYRLGETPCCASQLTVV